MRPATCLGTTLLAVLACLAAACGEESSSEGTAGSSPASDAGPGGSSSGGAAGSSGGQAGSSGAQGGAAGAQGGAAGSQGGGAGTGGGAGASSVPTLGGCPVFTPDDDWNTDVSAAAVDPTWTQNVLALAGNINLHPDLGNYETEVYGIPINVVPQDQAMVPISFDWWEDQSDPGPYPFPQPDQIKIEGGDPYECNGDCHVLVVQQGTCMLYEGFACFYDSGWHCGNGAKWDLTKTSYGQRQKGWTSADAAGLAIAPGLIRYDEVQAGEIKHAIRFTMSCTRSKYVKPATHYAVPTDCPDDANHPPMGLRVRLAASFDTSGFNPTARVILEAMKKYGMILADNGSDFFFQGAADPGWNDDLDALKQVPASAFEAIVPPPLEP